MPDSWLSRRLNETMFIKHLEHCLACRRCSINVRCCHCFKSVYSRPFPETLGGGSWLSSEETLAFEGFCNLTFTGPSSSLYHIPTVQPCFPAGLSDQQLLPRPCFSTLWALLLLLPLQGPLNPGHMQCKMSFKMQHPLEKGMATHFSIFAWRIPWIEELGGL